MNNAMVNMMVKAATNTCGRVFQEMTKSTYSPVPPLSAVQYAQCEAGPNIHDGLPHHDAHFVGEYGSLHVVGYVTEDEELIADLKQSLIWSVNMELQSQEIPVTFALLTTEELLSKYDVNDLDDLPGHPAQVKDVFRMNENLTPAFAEIQDMFLGLEVDPEAVGLSPDLDGTVTHAPLPGSSRPQQQRKHAPGWDKPDDNGTGMYL